MTHFVGHPQKRWHSIEFRLKSFLAFQFTSNEKLSPKMSALAREWRMRRKRKMNGFSSTWSFEFNMKLYWLRLCQSGCAECEFAMCSCLINDKIYWTWFLRTCSALSLFFGRWVSIKKYAHRRKMCDYDWQRTEEGATEKEKGYCRKNHIYDAHFMWLVQSMDVDSLFYFFGCGRAK